LSGLEFKDGLGRTARFGIQVRESLGEPEEQISGQRKILYLVAIHL
jgi:hypothetical protein